MIYSLRFAHTLRKEGSTIVEDPDVFIVGPVRISMPEVAAMVQRFIGDFEPMGIVESGNIVNNDAKPVEEVFSNINGSSAKDFAKNKTTSLKSLQGKAFVRQKEKIDPATLKTLRAELVEYLARSTSDLSENNLLSEDTDLLTSGIREALELRNYLRSWVGNQKKIYKEGYVYVTVG